MTSPRLLIAVTVLALSGCILDAITDFDEIIGITVTGTVTSDGVPIEGAEILQFNNPENEEPWTPIPQSDSEGVYLFNTVTGRETPDGSCTITGNVSVAARFDGRQSERWWLNDLVTPDCGRTRTIVLNLEIPVR